MKFSILMNGKDFHKETRAKGRKKILGKVKSNNKDKEERNMLEKWQGESNDQQSTCIKGENVTQDGNIDYTVYAARQGVLPIIKIKVAKEHPGGSVG